MKTKPKIAVIGLKGLPAFGGAAAVGENIIEQLKNQYDFTVYSVSSHTDLKTGVYKGFQQIVFNKITYKKLNTLLYYIKSMLAVLFGNYDLVHLHHRDAAFIIPFLRIRNKVILTTHGMVLTKKWAKFKWVFNIQDKVFLGLASRITTVSLKDFRIVSEKLKSSNKIRYIPNGVVLSSNIRIKNEDYIMFAAGRIVPDKGCHTFLQALIDIKYEGKVLIVGDMDQMPSYKRSILELASRLKDVAFTGLVTDKPKLFKYIRSAKLFVYPSEIESMSMMLLEVASLETPIICADIPENKDIFANDEVTYFKNKDSQSLADCITKVLNDDKLLKSTAKKALKKLELKYQWGDIALMYNEEFSKLI